MKFSAYILFVLIISSIIISCDNQNVLLPKSEYFVPIRGQGINRNIFLEINNGKLFSNNIEVSKISSLREYPEKYTTLNDGSNYFTLLLNIPNNSSGRFIDSLFFEFAKYRFLKIFLLTNSKNDSVGIPIHLRPIDIPLEYQVTEEQDSLINHISYCSNKFLINGTSYDKNGFKKICNDRIQQNGIFEIKPDGLVEYKDFVLLIDIYYSELHKCRSRLSINRFNISYSKLTNDNKHMIDKMIQKRLLIRYTEPAT